MAEMVRVNTRISANLNNWLDERSGNTGIPKSTLILLALEQYMQQIETLGKAQELSKLLEKLEGMN